MKPRIWLFFCQGISFSVIAGSIYIKSQAQLFFEVELYYMYIQVHAFNNEIIIYTLNYPFQVSCLSFSEFCVLKHHLSSAGNLSLLHHRYDCAISELGNKISTFLPLHNFLVT